VKRRIPGSWSFDLPISNPKGLILPSRARRWWTFATERFAALLRHRRQAMHRSLAQEKTTSTSLLRQSAWCTLGNLWAAALQLLLSALLIRLIGIDAFGEWLLVSTLILMCSLASAGIGPGMSLRLQSASSTVQRSAILREAFEATLV